MDSDKHLSLNCFFDMHFFQVDIIKRGLNKPDTIWGQMGQCHDTLIKDSLV